MKQQVTFERAYAGAVNVVINGNEVGMIAKHRDNKWYVYGDFTPIPSNAPFRRLHDAKGMIKSYIEDNGVNICDPCKISIRDEITNGGY